MKILDVLERVKHYMGSAYFYRPQRSCGKVIFSQASVSHSVHSGGVHPRAGTPPGQVHPRGRCTPWQVHPLGRCTPWAGTPPTPPPHDGHCSGWYASYCNAFLKLIFLLVMVDMTIVTAYSIAHKPKQKCLVWHEYCSTCRDVHKWEISF